MQKVKDIDYIVCQECHILECIW